MKKIGLGLVASLFLVLVLISALNVCFDIERDAQITKEVIECAEFISREAETTNILLVVCMLDPARDMHQLNQWMDEQKVLKSRFDLIANINTDALLLSYMKQGNNLADFKKLADDFRTSRNKLMKILGVK